MAENAREVNGNPEGNVPHDLKLILHVEREGNGCVAAGGNESRLLIWRLGGWATCDEPVLEERQPRRLSGKKHPVEGCFAWFPLER